jgi:hypothetical protein
MSIGAHIERSERSAASKRSGDLEIATPYEEKRMKNATSAKTAEKSVAVKNLAAKKRTSMKSARWRSVRRRLV